MKALVIAVALFLGLIGPAFAELSEEAKDAYRRGDFEAVARLFKEPALGGDAFAQYVLGLMHVQGRGVPINPVEAAKWFQMAAEQGQRDAQTM